MALGLFLSSIAVCKDEVENEIENTRVALEQWIETQRIISSEKKEFQFAREMLNERIELVEREIVSINKKISDAEESIDEADKKRAEMIEENEKLQKASKSLINVAENLESEIKNLLFKLPAPIRDRIKPLTQRLPEKDKALKITVAERFQNIIGILNEIDKFNREISVTSEVRTLKTGKSIEVTALYLGIGQGYYCSADGTLSGIGTVTDEGWQWIEANAFAGQISDAIAILKNEKVATFVNLPVEIN